MIRDLLPFFGLMRRRAGWLSAGMVLMLTTLLASFGLLATSGWFVTATGVAGAALAAGGTMTLEIYRPGAAIRFFALLRTVSRYFERLVTHEATFRLLADLRVWLFRRIASVEAGRLGLLRSGDMLNRLTGDIDAMDHLYLRVVAPVGVGLLALLVAAVVLWQVSPAAAVAGVGILAVGGIGLAAAAGVLGNRPGRRAAEAQADLRILAVDGVQGLAALKAEGADGAHAGKLQSTAAAYHDSRRRMAGITGLANGGLSFAGGLAMWAGALIALGLPGGQPVSGPELALLVLGLLALSEAVQAMPLAAQYLGATAHAGGRILGISRQGEADRSTHESESDSASQGAVGDERPRLTPSPADGRFEIRNVRLRYRSHDAPALDGITLTIAEGDCLAITGPSGCGKSSIAQAMLGLWPLESGQILLGGADVRTLDDAERARWIGYLDQGAHLFSGTVAENLRLAAPDATDAMLAEALRVACFDEVLARLDNGLDSWIGEGGARLSVGQARRLALARVIVRDPAVVILDEPTASLDTDTEHRLIERLRPWLTGRTTILITHAEAPLTLAQGVAMMRAGRIDRLVESETHVRSTTHAE